MFALHCIALWPVWRWYMARIQDGSDEPWGILALATVAVFTGSFGRKRELANSGTIICAALLGLYLVSLLYAPPLVRAIIGLASLAVHIGGRYFGKPLHLGIIALLILSLPLIASLQFYAGYPIRLLTAHISAGAISAAGYSVTAHGTALKYLGELVSVDAPCAGIRMLWSGLYLSFTLACFYRLSWTKTWLSYVLASLVIFSGNLVRSTILFFGESRIISFPAWAHQGIGLACFAGVALAIVFIQGKLKNVEHS